MGLVMTNTNKAVRAIASEGYKVISKTEAHSFQSTLSNGMLVEVVRQYHRRPIRVAWSPYYRLSVKGATKITNSSLAEFVRVASQFITRQEGR